MLSDLVSKAFPDADDLYSIFGLTKDASEGEIKKAYFKLARKCHPDKVSTNLPQEIRDVKTGEFQALSGAYEILSDPTKRSNYDQYGLSSDDSMGMDEPDCGWTEYFNAIYQRVDEGKIKVFEDKYKGSEEEGRDVVRWYGVCKGDLRKMLECVMLSTEADFSRWVEDYIKPAISKGEVEEFEITGWEGGSEVDGEEVGGGKEGGENEPPKKGGKKVGAKKKKKKKRDEAKEAEELMNAIRGKSGGIGGDADGDLAAMILGGGKRKNPMEDMLKSMEERYGGGSKKTKKSTTALPDDPLDDAEFERIQKEMMERRR